MAGAVWPQRWHFSGMFPRNVLRFVQSTSMTPDHGIGMHRNKGSAAVEKEKAPGLTQRPGLPSYASREWGTGVGDARLACGGMAGLAEELPQDTSPQARRRRGRPGRSNLPWDGQISRLEWKCGDGCKPRRMTSWDKLASRLEGIRSYRWKSRCRLLRNQLLHRRPVSRRTSLRPSPNRNWNRQSSADADHHYEHKWRGACHEAQT